MPLVLRIENVDTLPDGGPLSVEVERRGIDIGRDTYLDWTLPDAERFISGKHCEVHYRDGAYWLHDVSTNGTSVNGRGGRLTEPHRIADGDRIHIGNYIIAASIRGEPTGSAAPAPTAETAGGDPANPWGGIEDADQAMSRRDFDTSSRPAQSMPSASGPGDMSEENIAWGVGDVSAGEREEIDWGAPPTNDSGAVDVDWATPPKNDEIPPPKPSVRNPLDPATTGNAVTGGPAWSEGTGSPAEETTSPTGEQPGPEAGQGGLAGQWAAGSQAPARPAADPPPSASPSAPPIDATVSGAFVAAFERGAGLSPGAVADRSDEALAEELGRLFRSVSHNLQVMLLARAETKSAMRSTERTMIGALENNPLKFSPTAEDALKLMFGAPTRSYLDAEKTLEASFGDLQKHQMQTFAAMQQALQALIDDLSPDTISGATSKDGGLAALVSSRRAKFWDTYVERFNAKAGRHERGMIDAFMILFSEMYDRQG